jgi:hypothetical protein
MIHEADLHRLDAEARRIANDNRPSATEYPYHDEDLEAESFRQLMEALFGDDAINVIAEESA